MYTSFILIILVLFILLLLSRQQQLEGFEQPSTELDDQYKRFLDFYVNFCTIWKKATTTSFMISTNSPQPLTKPSDINSQDTKADTTQVPPMILNRYIQELSVKENKPFPLLCIDFPTTLDDNAIMFLSVNIPSDSTPYMNALQWINTHLGGASDNLSSALGGAKTEGYMPKTLEGFQEYTSPSCAIIQQGAQNTQSPRGTQNAPTSQQIIPLPPQTIEGRCDVETAVLDKLRNFISSNPKLEQTMKQAKENTDKANQIAADAQSGKLINQVNIPPTGPSDALQPNPIKELIRRKQQEDPQKFEENSINYPRLAELSKWFSSIV